MQIKVCDDDSGGGSMGGERKTYLRKVSTWDESKEYTQAEK